MNETEKKKPLSLEEGAALLGADEAEDIGEVRLDPIGMLVLATKIGKRLASKRGRPTDTSWEIQRKVPMKKETWDQLGEMADALAAQDVRVAPGQLAAIALERGLSALTEQKTEDAAAAAREVQPTGYELREEAEEEATELCLVLKNERFW